MIIDQIRFAGTQIRIPGNRIAGTEPPMREASAHAWDLDVRHVRRVTVDTSQWVLATLVLAGCVLVTALGLHAASWETLWLLPVIAAMLVGVAIICTRRALVKLRFERGCFPREIWIACSDPTFANDIHDAIQNARRHGRQPGEML